MWLSVMPWLGCRLDSTEQGFGSIHTFLCWVPARGKVAGTWNTYFMSLLFFFCIFRNFKHPVLSWQNAIFFSPAVLCSQKLHILMFLAGLQTFTWLLHVRIFTYTKRQCQKFKCYEYHRAKLASGTAQLSTFQWYLSEISVLLIKTSFLYITVGSMGMGIRFDASTTINSNWQSSHGTLPYCLMFTVGHWPGDVNCVLLIHKEEMHNPFLWTKLYCELSELGFFLCFFLSCKANATV